MILQTILERVGLSISWNGFSKKDQSFNWQDGSKLFSTNFIPLQVTSKAKEVDFGSITRATEDGTETMFMLKIKDAYGSVFKFLLSEPEEYNSETLDEAAEHFHAFTDLMGYE